MDALHVVLLQMRRCCASATLRLVVAARRNALKPAADAAPGGAVATQTASESVEAAAAVGAATAGARAQAKDVATTTCALPPDTRDHGGYALSPDGTPDVNFGKPPPAPPASKIMRSVSLWYLVPMVAFYGLFHHACVLAATLLLHFRVFTFKQVKNKYMGLGLLRYVIEEPQPKPSTWPDADAGPLERHCSAEFAGLWSYIDSIAEPWVEFECAAAVLSFPIAWRISRRIRRRPV